MASFVHSPLWLSAISPSRGERSRMHHIRRTKCNPHTSLPLRERCPQGREGYQYQLIPTLNDEYCGRLIENIQFPLLYIDY